MSSHSSFTGATPIPGKALATDNSSTSTSRKLRNDLCRLARFGANLTDAYSCFIFLPHHLLSTTGSSPEGKLELGGLHSLSNDVAIPCLISPESGLIGWTAKHRRSIHVSPFERDSRTLGVYKVDQQLKSFIATPIRLRLSSQSPNTTTGVVACDSKKSFAFSKVQGKLLDDLAHEIANTVELNIGYCDPSQDCTSWKHFISQSEALIDSIGVQNSEVLRIGISQIQSLEIASGLPSALDTLEALYRLIQQALPPHFPLFRLPEGGCLTIIDKMMGAYYQNKIQAIFNSLSLPSSLSISFHRNTLYKRRFRAIALEQAIAEAALPPHSSPIRQRGHFHEHR
ncbi:MAG: GAF domain-containing protein [Bdellovibrionales bacterium]|nr:GAF domain-containing protein [Bdellovibrionales bacterium]